MTARTGTRRSGTHGLSKAQRRVLQLLAEREPLTTINLAWLTGSDGRDMYKRLRLLEGRGLVKRQAHGERDALWGIEPLGTDKRHRVVCHDAIMGDVVAARQQTTCASCGEKRTVIRHHDDYAYPERVRLLCAQCHGIWHRDNEPANKHLRGSTGGVLERLVIYLDDELYDEVAAVAQASGQSRSIVGRRLIEAALNGTSPKQKGE
jgi:DNA-binding MarR family transcriptional regulator